jgi:hypothetical protein
VPHDLSRTESPPITLSRSGREPVHAWWTELALLAIFAGIVCMQVFIPPYIGMADNGDFAKIARRLSLISADPHSGIQYFNADYILSRGSRWDSDFRSSEEWPADLAFFLSRVTKEGDVFNIRWLGAVHAIILVTAFALVLVATRGLTTWASIGVRIAILWIFSDVVYVSYLNSFYSDTAALLGLLGSVALATLIITRGPQVATVLGFLLFAVLLIASKSQHALWGFLPALFLYLTTRNDKRLVIRCLGAGTSTLLLVGIIVVVAITPAHYKGEAQFNLIFRKLAKSSLNPGRDLQDLGLPASEIRYIGHTAYDEGTPAADAQWFADFCSRTSYLKTAAYYLRHPMTAFQIMREDLQTWARYIRYDFGNFRRQDAVRPGQRSEKFALWSDVRIRMFFWWPSHILVWYAMLAAGVCVVLWMRPSGIWVKMAWLTAGLAVAAGCEYSTSSLGDSEETFRHLFLFHALTDVTVCMVVAAMLSGTLRQCLSRHRSSPGTPGLPFQ